MASVFLVTQGEYSGYGVVAAFSALDSANAFVDARVQPDSRGRVDYSWRVEEYGLDEPDPAGDKARAGLVVWRVEMARDGTATEAGTIALGRTDSDYIGVFRHNWGHGNAERLVVIAWARDEKHAVKIANEKRTQWIASGEWAPLPAAGSRPDLTTDAS